MRWRILIEPEGGAAPGEPWDATGEVFDGDIDALSARLAALQAETGRCHGAEQSPPTPSRGTVLRVD